MNKIEFVWEKFSIINDILKFFENYNRKYRTKLNLNNIIDNDDDIQNIINKVCNYLLDFYFDIDTSELVEKCENINNNALSEVLQDDLKDGFFVDMDNDDNKNDILQDNQILNEE